MATIVVLDDQPHYLARAHTLIEQCAPQDDSRIILDASSLDDLMEILATGTHIDILVADIMMPAGQPSGIDIVQSMFPAADGTQIIYMSADLSLATEVYRTEHLYYLLKPIDPDKLRSALNRAYGALHGTRPHMLSVVCDHKDQLINVSSIRYLESKLHKVLIHCGTKVFATYARLNELQGRLPKHFSRCHQSYLVNLAYVSSFDGRQVLLHDGTPIPVSRRHAQTLQKDLLSYIKSHRR